jgi:hypothetical protein
MDTIKMIPITMHHPEEGYVDASVASREAIGITGESVEENGDMVLANLVIFDEAAVRAIRNKEICELSLGYTSDIEQTSGEHEGMPFDCVQRNIRYNHLSVVERGRAGSRVRIVTDSLGDYMTAKTDEQDIPRDAQIKAPITPRTISEEFGDYRTRTDARMDEMEKKIDKILDNFEELKGKKSDEESEEGERKEQVRKYVEGDNTQGQKRDRMDAEVRKEAERRANYLVEAFRTMPEKEFKEMHELRTDDIRDHLLKKMMPEESFSGRCGVYRDAAFDIAVARRSETRRADSTPSGKKDVSAEKFVSACNRPLASIKVSEEE